MWERKRMINRKKNGRNKTQFSVTTKIILSTNKFNSLSNTCTTYKRDISTPKVGNIIFKLQMKFLQKLNIF